LDFDLSQLKVDSNVTVKRPTQRAKHVEQRISTEAGIQIDLSDVQEKNTLSSIGRS
jgi:hypothetical protein